MDLRPDRSRIRRHAQGQAGAGHRTERAFGSGNSGRRAGINPAPTWRLHAGDNAAGTGKARVGAHDFACRQLSTCTEGTIGAKLGGEC